MVDGIAKFAIAAMVCSAFASGASAGVIRHDAADQSYLNLATGYDSVGQFRFGNYSASGTVIGSNWVLTAGHVLDVVTDSLTFHIGEYSLNAVEWISHSAWNGDLTGGYDIGLVRFDDTIDFETTYGISPAQLYSGKDEIGAIATAVGFGRTGTGLTGATTFDGKKRAGTNSVDAELLTKGKGNRVLLSDFDNPNDFGLGFDNSYGSSDPLALEYLIGPGDSGGGLFADFNGTEYLIGVHSFVWGRLDGIADSDYGDVSGHTRVSSFYNWINETTSPSGGGGGGGGGGGKGNGGGRPAFGSAAFTVAQVPEPETFGIFVIGLISLGLVARRRGRSGASNRHW